MSSGDAYYKHISEEGGDRRVAYNRSRCDQDRANLAGMVDLITFTFTLYLFKICYFFSVS